MFADLVPFDLETTGPDPFSCRMVSAAVGAVSPGADPAVASYLVAVDVDIPAEATDVHGITTGHAREYGKPAVDVAETVATALTQANSAGVPIVGMNLVFDLTVLDRELRRLGLRTLPQRLGRPVGPVVDIYVIDKHVDRYRRGKRRLGDLCAHYGVPQEGAHDAAVDAIAAARVAYALADRAGTDRRELRARYADRPRQAARIADAFAELGRLSLTDLHRAQQAWHAEQATDLAAYFRQKANEERHRAETTTDDAEREFALADAERLRAEADRVITDWPVAG